MPDSLALFSEKLLIVWIVYYQKHDANSKSWYFDDSIIHLEQQQSY